MTLDETKASIRLMTLLDAVESLENAGDASERLLELCIEQSITSYINVPLGHVAVVYRRVRKELKRLLFKTGRPVVQFKSDPFIAGHIKYVELDIDNLRGIRDAGAVAVDSFLHGGLEAGKSGLLPVPFEYCVIQMDSRHPFSADKGFFPESLLEGQVYPIERTIRLSDVLIAREDAQALRKLLAAVIEIPDKWGHKEEAPSVFLIYQAAHEFEGKSHNYKAVAEWLMAHDRHGVFTVKIAEFAGRLIKKDVRIKQKGLRPSRLAFDKISNNVMKKDYTEAIASDRLSLLHLATDCWIHDRENPLGPKFVPGRLDQLLFDLGFEESEKDPLTSQVEFLRRVIEGQAGREQFKNLKSLSKSPEQGNR